MNKKESNAEKMKNKLKLNKISLKNPQHVAAILFVLGVAVVGSIYLFGAHAASPWVAAEAENGTLTAPATVATNSNASGGKYVQFGSSGSGGGGGSTGVPLLGFSTGGPTDPQDMADVSLLGGRVPLAEFFLDGGSYTNSGWNMGISEDYYINAWQSYPYRLIIGIPTLDGGETLAQCATGQYNQYYTAMGQDLVNRGYSHTIVRLGWEFNGTWYGNQDANTDPTDWVTCFRGEASALKAADPNVMIDFNPTAGEPAWNGNTPFDWRSVYPGDQYVDIVGLDVYDNDNHYPAGSDNNPPSLANEQAAWNDYVNETGGLQDQVNFAAAHNKLLSVPEWGLVKGGYNQQDGGDDPYYIQQMAKWITTHNYYYESYFNVNASDGDHYLGDFPNAQTEFINDFKPLLSQPPNNVAPVK